MQKIKQPEIRFQEYNDNWREYTLGELATITRGLTYKPSDITSTNEVRVLRSSNIVGDSFILNEDDVFVDKRCVNISKIKNGDILVTAANGSTRLVGKHAVVSHLNDSEYVVHGGFMLLIRSKEPYFINAWMGSSEYISILKLVQGGNGAIGNLSLSMLAEARMTIPSNAEEYRSIGTLFQTLDELLSDYKNNLANYQAFKASMLSKMFPKAGQTTPEIRLDGFEGEWAEKKLGEVTERVQGNDGRMDLPTLTISAANGWMNQEDRFSQNIAGKEQKNYTLLKKGELSYNHGNSKLAKYGVVFELESYEEALVPRVYHSFRVKDGLSDAKFIETMFTAKRLDRELGKLVSSGARMDGLLNINYDEFMGIKITLPRIEEQQAIGSFFSNLDNLISSCQEKIDQLETLKKKLLQDMFI